MSLCLCVLWLLCVAPVSAQDLPDRIRGYRVYRADVSVKNRADQSAEKFDAAVEFGDPVLASVSPFGIEFELSAEITTIEQNGQIDFLTFHDFRVNGTSVRIDEYKEPFKIKKNKPVRLADPVKIRVSLTQAARAALREWSEAEPEWTVTGTVFVFGRFKKSFLSFKRVVPVEINLKIKNPLKQRAAESR